MNPPSNPSPSDRDLERLLGSHVQRTSPEFEQRWREVRQALVAGKPVRRPRFTLFWLWPGLATAAVASVTAFLMLHHATPPPLAPQPLGFEELLALDAALAPASPLFDPETRDALLHLPLNAKL